MIRITTLLTLLLLSLNLFSQTLNLIPYPREISQTGGELILDQAPNIVANSEETRPLAELLASDIFRLTGLAATANPSGSEDIVISINPSLSEDEYELKIDTNITVTGNNYLSASHGVTSILQLLSYENKTLNFPKVSIKDRPANEYRSVSIDVARQVVHISTLKHTVDLCRLYKIPFIQIHIADDQSFCFPSTNFPELATPDHSYTLDELEELVEYATIRGVRIIPELDGPGHSTAIRKANPDVFGSSSFSVLDLVSDTMYEGMGILLKELLDVFHTAPYFHIGADEASLNDAFLNSDHVNAFMEAHEYSGEDLQRMYVTKLDSMVKSLGKKTMAWESFKADNLNEKIKIPTDMLINAWETLYERPENYIKAGFDIINSSWKPYYTTRWKRWNPEVIYNFSKFSFANHWIYAPSYNQFDIEPTEQVKGGQMSVWEEFDIQIVSGIRNRVPAFSEYYWLEDERPGYSDYALRFKELDKLFDKLVLAADLEIEGTYSMPLEPSDWAGETLPNPNGDQNNYQYYFKNEVTLKATPMAEGVEIHYTTNSSFPEITSPILDKTLAIDKTTLVKMIAVKDSHIIGYQQIALEHRPIIAHLTGLREQERAVEPYSHNHEFWMPLTIEFEDLENPDHEIRYTTNGSRPSHSSSLYEAPIQLEDFGEHTVRARSYKGKRAIGKEWKPADHYDFVSGERYWSFNGMDPNLNLTTFKPILETRGYDDATKPGSMINDGIINNNNFWHSGSGFPQSLVIDLEAVHTLDRFHVWFYWADGRKFQYKIQLSTDESHFTTYVDETDNTQSSTADGFDHTLETPIDARYIKIIITGNSANAWSHVVELYAYEKNNP